MFTWTPSGLMAMKLRRGLVGVACEALRVVAAYVCSLEDIVICM